MKSNEKEALTTSLDKVMPYFNHKGALVERLIGGFRWNGKTYLSIAELEADMEFAKTAISQSIIK